MRRAHALRPEGIEGPRRDDGATSFRLEHLAAANGVREGEAHEALSDVRALIGIARRLRTAQPRLWDYALGLRDKRRVAALLDPIAMQPILHVSQRYTAARLCAAAVLPLAVPSSNATRRIVFDLAGTHHPLLAPPPGENAAPLQPPRAAPPFGDHALGVRDKRRVAALLDPFAMQPILHVSQRYPAARLCAAAVLPLAVHPSIATRVIVFDLAGDIEPLLALPPGEIAARLYLRREEDPDGT